jgi:hypothetical protein
MSVAIPGKRTDPRAWFDVKSVKQLRNLFSASMAIGIGVTMDIPLGAPRDDFCVGMVPRSMNQEPRYQQWLRHHLTHQQR